MNQMRSPRSTTDYTVKLDQVPRWTDAEPNEVAGWTVVSDGGAGAARRPKANGSATHGRGGAGAGPRDARFVDPLSSPLGDGADPGSAPKFPVDAEINSRLYLWRGEPWPLEVDAVVNTTNETLDESMSSPGLHAAAGPLLAEECAALGGCRTGEARITNGYNLPARRVLHTVGPRYAPKYHTAAENALSLCYRSCLEALIEHGLKSIAFGCIYTETKGYPREPAAHVAIRTVRRFLEKHKDKVAAVIFCTFTLADTEIYKRLLPLYFPRDEGEEDAARGRLPPDVGDENGGALVSERRIRISTLPGHGSLPPTPRSFGPPGEGLGSPAFSRQSTASSRVGVEVLEEELDPSFMMMTRDPDQRREEQWQRAMHAQQGWWWAKWVGLKGVGGPPLSPSEEASLHARVLARANARTLTDIEEMKILYRGGVDGEGRQVMMVVGAHFLARAMDLDRFVLFVVKEMEPVMQRPFVIVYLHSTRRLPVQPDFGWMRRLEQMLGQRHRTNLHAIYVLHPTLGLKAAVTTLKLLVEPQVWRRVIYVERLLDLFHYVPRTQMTIPDFVVQHDTDLNPTDIGDLNARIQRDHGHLTPGYLP